MHKNDSIRALFPLLHSVIVFVITQVLGVGLGVMFYVRATEYGDVATPTSPFYFIAAFLIATVILLLLLKFVKKDWVFLGLFYLAIIQGVLLYLLTIFGSPAGYLISGVLVFLLLYFNTVLIHNLILTIALGGIAAFFGVQFTPIQVVFILIFLAIYDYWAVYKTKHMVELFSGLAQKQVHFAFITPKIFSGLKSRLRFVTPGKEYFFLGTGDVALPLILAVSALQYSLTHAIFVITGSVCGFLALHILFMRQKEPAPMAGLPPIIMGALLGFALSLLV